MAELTLANVSKNFGTVQVIPSASLEIKEGEFVVFVGPSGCGKSTLLRMIAGLEEVSGGSIQINGTDITKAPPAKRNVAMVFQSYALYPHMTVGENIGFGLRIGGVPKAERAAKVAQAAEVLQLTPLLNRKPGALSGGQRQRVAIGRAIVKKPGIFLFDEPLSNLDAELRVQMRLEIASLHKELGATMIYVTHDQVEAMTLADKIVVLRRGTVEQVGAPLELYEHPANIFVAGFIGSPKMNFIKGTVSAVLNDVIEVTSPAAPDSIITARKPDMPVSKGDHVTLGIRPEHTNLAKEGVPATSGFVERLGNVSFAYLTLADGTPITVERRSGDTHSNADDTHATFDPMRIHVFDAAGQRL